MLKPTGPVKRFLYTNFAGKDTNMTSSEKIY